MFIFILMLLKFTSANSSRSAHTDEINPIRFANWISVRIAAANLYFFVMLNTN